MSDVVEIGNYKRRKPYTARKAKKNSELEFGLMLKKMERSLVRALNVDRLAGWPEDQANRIREGGP